MYNQTEEITPWDEEGAKAAADAERKRRREEQKVQDQINRVLGQNLRKELFTYLASNLLIDPEVHVDIDEHGTVKSAFYASDNMSTIIVEELNRIKDDNGYEMELEVCEPSPMVFINRKNGYYATFKLQEARDDTGDESADGEAV